MAKSASVRYTVHLFLLAATLTAANPLPAIANETTRFEVTTADSVQAIQSFSEQSGLQILVSGEQLNGKKLREVRGTLSNEDGLNTLLKGTGLAHKYVNERTVALVTETPKSSHSAAAAGTGTSKDASADKSQPRNDATLDSSIDEVTVTAQKRQERLQDVPISMSVMTGEALDHSTAQGLHDALRDVPGVFVVDGGGSASDKKLMMRGMGTAGFNSGASPVAFYLDGSPLGMVMTDFVPDMNVYDLDRVEVLRGPQGTLYGASAQAGVIRILTKDADLEDFAWKARTIYSNTQYGSGNVRADTAVNVPIVEGRLAARAVVGYEDLSGWIDKPTRSDANDTQSKNARLKLNAKVTDALTVGLSAWVSRSHTDAFNIASRATERRSLTPDMDYQDTEFDNYALNINYDFPAFSLTSTTSRFDGLMRPKLGVALIELTPKGLSQEINLASTQAGPWRWTAGTIYRDEQDDQYVSVQPILALPQLIRRTSESWAAYGELTRAFDEGRFELTAGLRYFEDRVGLQEKSRLGDIPPEQYTTRDSSFDATTPRVIFAWKPGVNTTVYTSYSEGFRSGFQQSPELYSVLPDVPDAQPDHLTNYEVGTKGQIFDGHLAYDVAAYYMDWQDVQQPLQVYFTSTDSYQSLIVNGASASGTGVDAAFTIRPVEALELGVSVGWNDLRVDEDVLSSGFRLLRKGERLAGSSALTAGASSRYSVSLGTNGLEASVAASASFQSKSRRKGVINDAVETTLTTDSLLLARLGLSVGLPNRWQVTLFAENITNEQGSPADHLFLADRTTQIRPRTIGMQLEYKL